MKKKAKKLKLTKPRLIVYILCICLVFPVALIGQAVQNLHSADVSAFNENNDSLEILSADLLDSSKLLLDKIEPSNEISIKEEVEEFQESANDGNTELESEVIPDSDELDEDSTNEVNLEKQQADSMQSKADIPTLPKPADIGTVINGRTYVISGTDGNSTAALVANATGEWVWKPKDMLGPDRWILEFSAFNKGAIPDTVTKPGWKNPTPVVEIKNLSITWTGEYGGTIEYDGFDYSGANISIGSNVREIHPSCFDTKGYKTGATGVTFRGTVLETIGRNAFRGNNIQYVTIPDSVTTIEQDSFANNELSTIVIGKNLTTIGQGAFYKNNLYEVKIEGLSSKKFDKDVFSGNPLGLIIAEGASWATYEKLSPSVMNGVTQKTIVTNSANFGKLKTGTLSEYKVNTTNRTLNFEVEINGYQLNNLSDYKWSSAGVKASDLGCTWVKDGAVFDAPNSSKLTLSDVDKTQQGSYKMNYKVGSKMTSSSTIKVTVEDYFYEFSGTSTSSTASITKYLGTSKDISIPGTATNHELSWANASSVTSIKDGYTGVFESKELTRVILPNSLKTIGMRAFKSNMLTSLTIPSSMTNIGDGAFDSNKLTSVTIPNSVTILGDSAFSYNKLTSVTLPSNMTSIGNKVFQRNNLTNVTLPNGLKNIGNNAFSENSLTNVTLPNGLTSIGDSAFSENSLTNVTLPNGLTSIGVSAFSTNKLTDVTLPNSVTSIGGSAFRNNSLASIKVSREHFDRIKGLLVPSVMYGVTARTILESTTGTGSYVAGTLSEYKVNTANRSLNFELEPIGPRFQLNSTTARLWVDIGSEVEWFKDSMATGTKTEKLTLSNVGKNQVGTYYAVVNGTKLSNIKVTVEDYVFEFSGTVESSSTATVSGYLGTSKSISIPATATNHEAKWTKATPVTSIKDGTVSSGVFYNKGLTSVTLPSSVTHIGISAFSSNRLTDVTLPSSVTSIENYAFFNNALTNVTLSNSVTSLGTYAFSNNKLTSVTLPNSVTSLGTYAFSNNKLTSVTLPNSVTSLGTYAFSNNELTSVTLPNSVTSMGISLFQGNSLASIKVSSEHMDRIKGMLTPGVMNGVKARTILESTTGTGSYVAGTLSEYKVNTANRSLNFEVEGLRYQLGDLTARLWVKTGLEVEWFKDSKATGTKTEKLTLSNVGKNQVGTYYAVVNGKQLSNINVVVDDYIFEFSGTVESSSTATVSGYIGTSKAISIPATAINHEAKWTKATPVTSIKDGTASSGVFYNKGLTSVTLPSSVTHIGISAFSYNALTNVTLPSSVTSIENYAFFNNALTNVTLPNSVTHIGGYAFSKNKLKSVTLGNSVKTIRNNAFSDNILLTSVTLPNSVTSMGISLFQGNSLASIKVSSEHMDRIRGMLTPGVMDGVKERTILETGEGFAYTGDTQDIYTLFEGDSAQFEVEGKSYQLDTLSSRKWEEFKVQWMKEGVDLKNSSRQFKLINVTDPDAGFYHAIIGEGDLAEVLPDIEVTVIPRQDREIPSTNPENPTVNPVDTNPSIEALGIRYVSSFAFGEISYSKNTREVRSTKLVDADKSVMPHMITIQDVRERNKRSGWKLAVKHESEVITGSELIINPYIHEANSVQYGASISTSELVVNEESQAVASVEGDASTYSAGIFSIGLAGSGNEGVRLIVPGGVGIGTYHSNLLWILTEGP